LLGGIGLAGFIGPVVNFGLWRIRDSLPFYLGWRELGRDVLAAALLGLLVVRGIPSSEVLSLLGLGAVVLSFTFVNTYLWVLGGVGQRAAVWRELDWPVVAALALTVLELVGFSLLRDWV
jgi:hypothetical protein